VRGRRVAPGRPECSDIVTRDPAARLRDMPHEAVIERRRPRNHNLFERPRKIGLAEHTALLEPSAAASIVPRPGLEERVQRADLGLGRV